MKIFFQAAPFARKMFFVFVSLFTVVLLSGCATITRGTTDTLHVGTANCHEPISCKASNKKGSWNFTASGSVKFKKSDNPLTITCQDGNETLTSTVIPTRGHWAWQNGVWVFLFGAGIVGAFVDAATDAHWDTADSIAFSRAYCRGKQTN